MTCPQITLISCLVVTPSEVEGSLESLPLLVQILICGNWDGGNLRMNKTP